MYETVSDLAGLARAVGDETAMSLANDLAHQIPSGEINLLVVGQFKRGKSTLVNALLGADLMPTGALPVTGVVTAIRYGVAPFIEVRFRAAGPRRIDVGELAQYVSERYNPGNLRGVERVDITWPAERIRGLALFDTPGVGSTLRHNSETARAALPRADVAILVVGPDPPIGEEELRYAREIQASSERLFIVLNKSDIAAENLLELLEFTKRAISGVTNEREPVEILPLSATIARERQRAQLEDPDFKHLVESLQQLVVKHGEATRMRSARRRARAIAARLEVLLAMRSEALNLPRLERERRKDSVEQVLRSVDDRVRALTLIVNDDVRRLICVLEEDLRVRYDTERTTIAVEADVLSDLPPSRRSTMVEQFIDRRAREWKAAVAERASRELCAATAKYARLVGELQIAALRAGCDALHMNTEILEPTEVTFASARLEIVASLVPTTGLELIVSFTLDLLPALVRKPFLKRRFEGLLSSELDALRGKLRYGIVRDIEPWQRAVRDTMTSEIAATRRIVLAAFEEVKRDSTRPETTERAHVDNLQRRLVTLSAKLCDEKPSPS